MTEPDNQTFNSKGTLSLLYLGGGDGGEEESKRETGPRAAGSLRDPDLDQIRDGGLV